jgi:hypothetical protein
MQRSRVALAASVLLLLATTALAASTPKPKPTKAAKATPAVSPTPAAADGEGGDEEAKPKSKIKIGCYVLNIGKFDVITGTYTVDFYLDITADPKESDMGEMKLEFMNGRAASTDKLIDTPHEKFYRIQANLATNVDMHRFPWDTHDLPLILEHSTRAKDELEFELDDKQTGIDPAVTFVGWNLLGFDQKVIDHEYPVYDEVYSQYVYTIHIARIYFVSTLKTFLPVLCFLVISMVSLLVTLEKLDSRIGMNTAMLIASVLYHLSIANQLPPAGYLTVADKVMVATYSTIGINLIISVHMMRLMQAKKDEAARKLREVCFWLVPLLAALGYFVVVVI